MGSIVPHTKIDKATGKKVTLFRAHVRRKGFASKSKIHATKTAAKAWLRENESTASLTTRGGGLTLKALVDQFVGAPPKRGYRYWRAAHLDFWQDQLGAMRARDISRGDINGAVAVLQTRPAMRSTPNGPKPSGQKLTPATINRYMASLASVFSYALDREIIDVHPMKAGQVKKLQESGGRTRILDDEEEQRLYNAAKASAWPLLYLFVRMAMTTGARKSEVLKLTWRQIDLAEAIAVWPKTKNGTARSLPLVSDVRGLLAEAAKVRPLKGDYVFFDPKHPEKPKNIDIVWRQCRAAAGLLNDRDDPLDRVVLHTARHSAVTKMLKGGANVAQVARVSGHKTLTMLKRYEHMAARESVNLAEKYLSGKGGTN